MPSVRLPKGLNMDTPWSVSWSPEGQSWYVLGESGHVIADAYESEVNARRMAAAPDMEKVLKALIYAEDHPGFLGSHRPLFTPAQRRTLITEGRAALVKAKGE